MTDKVDDDDDDVEMVQLTNPKPIHTKNYKTSDLFGDENIFTNNYISKKILHKNFSQKRRRKHQKIITYDNIEDKLIIKKMKTS